MKTKIQSNANCECLFDVDIPAEDVEKAMNEVYDEIKKYAKIPGFRPGSAPRDLLETYHGDNAREETLKRLIPKGCQCAIDEKKIDAVGVPEVFDLKFEKGQNLTFKARVETRPAFKPKNYKGIKVKSRKTEISEKEVGEVIERLCNMHAEFKAVEEKREVVKDDYTLCDVESFIDGKPITKAYKNMWIQVNKESSLLGVGENLIGLKAGDTKEIEVSLPADYPDPKFAGKKAIFKVTVNSIKEKNLPKLDDEFAKTLGEDTLQSLTDSIKKQLLDRKKFENNLYMKGQIADKLLTDNKISTPKSMVKRQSEVLEHQFSSELLSKGFQKNAVEEKVKEAHDKLLQEASDKVRMFFILEAIAVQEDVKVDDDDIEKKYADIAKSANRAVDAVKDYYEKNDLVEGLLVQVHEEKTLDWLLSQAEVTEE